MNRLTKPSLIAKLLKASQLKRTQLKLEEVRKIAGLTGKAVGIKTLNLLFPELQFRLYQCRGVYYVKITLRWTITEYTQLIREFRTELNQIEEETTND